MKNIQYLDDIDFNPDHSGKKAAPLHELTRMGLAVPPGFCISSAIRQSLQDSQSPLRDEIFKAVKNIGGYPVAVRSSSNLEDLGDASFAGLYDTFLNVSDEDQLIKNIENCFASAAGERVQAYLKNKNIQASHLDVSVLIQKMVPAKYSGVLFTLHPTLGKEEEAYVEACTGYGEKLVSGHTNPSCYRLALENGAILEATVSEEGECVSSALAKQLTCESLKIMAHFGRPQDIEWASDENGQLWILQSRPITQIQWRSDVEEYTNADFKDGGVSASVCTPLMFTLYEAAMQVSMQAYMQTIKLLKKNSEQKTWIRSFYGRAYWNASEVKRRLFKVPGFDEQSFDLDLGIQKNYGKKGPHQVPMNLWTLLPVIPVAFALEKEYRDQLKRTENYQSRFYLPEETRLLKTLAALNAPLPATLLAQVLEFQLKTECDYFSTIYSNTNLQGDFKKFLRDQEVKYRFQADLSKLFSGVNGITHLEAQTGLIELLAIAKKHGQKSTAYQEGRALFLTKYGFHADRELDLLCPRWSEVPELIDHRIAEFIRTGTKLIQPSSSSQTQNQQFELEKSRVAALISSSASRKKFLRELDRVRTYLRRREEMREVSTKAYALTRQFILAFGAVMAEKRQIDSASDVFFILRDELLDMAKHDSFPYSELKNKVLFRKQMYQGYRELTPPNELGFGTTAIQSGEWENDSRGLRILKGLGCSPGITKGVVCVVETLDQAYQLTEGQILVTRFTDPGWTAILGMVRGVITEVGGMLSHAAVIGRELGVPAILNLPKATQLLKTGDTIEMNGSTGEIRILREE